MKRNMELIKRLLGTIERDCHGDGIYSVDDDESLLQAGHTAEEINYHLQLMWDANLVDATDGSTFSGTQFLVRRLTWEGHEFLEAASNETVWKKVMDKIGGPLAGIPFSVLTALLIDQTKKQLGLS